ncbi:MAG: glycosyltransferase family 2 protein [Alphaproteobacteria bacterium]|nr:glycosyltransferase family 2 protein [Alphaproteobacteria bacterium]MBV9693157.1 glycosyltransferase family 2 protein [Alphaproteobacteria bacterium]
MAQAVAFSWIVAVKDEKENMAPLIDEIASAMQGRDPATYEVLFIDDGSSDGTELELARLKSQLPALRVLVHGRNLGKSAALRTGIRAARHSVIVTMDGDGQNDPADVHTMLAPFAQHEANLGIVAGQRIKREDTFAKRMASKIANRVRRWLLSDGTRDSVCGWKAMPRDLFLRLPYFDNMHRFLIALTMREGYAVRLIDVRDRRRLHGRSKYTNWGRLVVGVPDLLGVAWLMRRFRGSVEAREL